MGRHTGCESLTAKNPEAHMSSKISRLTLFFPYTGAINSSSHRSSVSATLNLSGSRARKKAYATR